MYCNVVMLTAEMLFSIKLYCQQIANIFKVSMNTLAMLVLTKKEENIH